LNENKSEKHVRILSSEGFFIALVPGIAYGLTFIYEINIALFYGFPLELIIHNYPM